MPAYNVRISFIRIKILSQFLNFVLAFTLSTTHSIFTTSEQKPTQNIQPDIQEEYVDYSKLSLVFGAAAVPFGIAGVYFVNKSPRMSPAQRIMGNFMSGLFMVTGALAFKDYFTSGHYMTINKDGITVRNHGFFEWQDIKGLYLHHNTNHGTIMLMLQDNKVIYINDSMLDASPEKILSKISRFRPVVYHNGVYLLL